MRFATFNIANGRSLSDGRVDADRLAAAVAALDADVVGLQEVDRDQPRSGGADQTAVAAEALGATAYRFAATLTGTPGETWSEHPPAEDPPGGTSSYGVALLSRWPVRQWRVVRLARLPVRSPVYVPKAGLILIPDEPRALLAAVVDSPAGPLTVATTHLSFVPGWNVIQLRRAARALADLPGPRFLLGDLNLPGALPAAVAGGLLPGTGGWRTLGRLPTYPSPAPRIQLDHVLGHASPGAAPPAVTAVETPDVPLSDHRPLVVTLAAD